ncbi:phosphatidylinositol transfer protein 3-like [Dioscorea cayenensis subsp. rotundata]|uniref:Phosphatidylinositol transfer protein 3-like n=1 Tax=Dioscorea cayennensis subsp. rotundata TaxID=55577 RepID=A0AB40BLS0_DIOCR|nr:phosphatidylinositol transfer protein 3-like [Dioscorea cayenensis subsp. rotundata]XP_039128351.1 phosphatidylinositol transfer protein 3-like [Dioscorea cayenensis subsp. rotundata]
MPLRKSRSNGAEVTLSVEEQQAKINEVRKLVGPLADQLPNFCSDSSISRYLRARNWQTEKACKMLQDTLKWRLQYKPETIKWEDIAHEAETGKIYRANYLDKYGRPVLVMRPGFQNTKSTKGQIRYLVYSMEHAILNLADDQEQMVWLIDFQGWTMGGVSLKVTRETAHILQDYYPERLGLAILYNPPKIFESFWKVVKPFLESKTYKKVKFVYSDVTESQKIMTEVFDMNVLETAFGGRNSVGFSLAEFSERMKEDDMKMQALLKSQEGQLVSRSVVLQESQFSISETQSETSSEDDSGDSSSPKTAEQKELVSENEIKEDKNGVGFTAVVKS